MFRSKPEITIGAAWRASVAVTARTYELSAASLADPPGAHCRTTKWAPSFWEARKVAVYVAVLAADCTFAALARAVGMHRDTVTSQCMQMRDRVIADPMMARRTLVLEQQARRRMRPELTAMFEHLAAAIEHQAELAEPSIGGSREARITDPATEWCGLPTRFAEPSDAHENLIALATLR